MKPEIQPAPRSKSVTVKKLYSRKILQTERTGLPVSPASMESNPRMKSKRLAKQGKGEYARTIPIFNPWIFHSYLNPKAQIIVPGNGRGDRNCAIWFHILFMSTYLSKHTELLCIQTVGREDSQHPEIYAVQVFLWWIFCCSNVFLYIYTMSLIWLFSKHCLNL